MLCAELLQEPVHQVSVVAKGIRELRVVGHRALAKTRIVRRDHVEAIGEGGNQVAEHVRRGREAVQQQDNWPIGRTIAAPVGAVLRMSMVAIRCEGQLFGKRYFRKPSNAASP